MRVAVAGGTGVVGRHVVARLRASGHDPVVLSRATGVDLTTGAGLQEALTGATAVVDVSNAATSTRSGSVAFFEAATRHLLDAGQAAGVTHHVALSIIGIDLVDTGYYAGKRRQEELVLAGPVPATVVRAAQFHEFAAQLLSRLPGPVAPVPRMLMQPVAAREVGEALAATAVGEPQGRAPELAGPEKVQLVDAVRRVLAAQGARRLVVPVRVPGAAGRAMADGALTPADGLPRTGQTFEAWLAESGGQLGPREL
jgi:uncharacterized protein YbjT (DUF2867 family)